MKAQNSIEHPGWELMARYLANEAGADERQAVETWAARSEQNGKELNELKLLLEKTGEFYAAARFNSDSAWLNLKKQISGSTVVSPLREKGRRFTSTFYKYAAIVVLALLVGTAAFYFATNNPQNNTYSEIISSEKQVVSEYVLPDGTVVTLNSNSKLQFPKTFENGVREVIITGEAFFDVVPNAEKPFLIRAGNATVTVLGTSFNVNAYPENETVEVIVKTGKVKVANNKNMADGSGEILLAPGEKGTVHNPSGTLEKTANKDMNYLAWKTHNLVFENTPLTEVVQYLNKTYHAEIRLEGENLENLALTAQFEKKPVDFILNVIRLTFGLELEQENDMYILSENKK